MCRIAGIINPLENSQNLHHQIKNMCSVMAAGGPDDEGYELVQNGIFGHRRLSLIDLTKAGHQPMQYQHLTITFNGEIYNYKTLKNQLSKQGHNFFTQSDTEVILVGFLAYGTAIFKLLEGMFAFALSDKKTNQTYLVRDEMGIKPLYISTENKKLIFASEIKAFKALGTIFKEDKDWKIYFLTFGHIPHPFSTLKNVFSLAGGHYLKWDNSDGKFCINDFKDELPIKSIMHKIEAENVLHQELITAIQNHLIADAPIGIWLSGGIDSSLITLLADCHFGDNLNTLAINFEEQAFNEEKYQKLISNKTKAKHQSYIIKQEEFNKEFETIIAAMDQPTSDGINSWFISKKANEYGLKAVLSGIGADELLGGYPSFRRVRMIKLLKILPRLILRLFAYLPSVKLNRIYFLSFQNPIGEYLFLRGFFTPKSIAKILERPIEEIENLLNNFPLEAQIINAKGQDRISKFESILFLKNQLLKDTDFMSMSHGLEVRTPFLAQQFVKNLNRIDNHIRFTKQPKGLLINAFKSILPKQIWNRKKMGFTFPLQQWFIKGGQLNSANYNEGASYWIKKFNQGKLHWSKAFALYQVFKKD